MLTAIKLLFHGSSAQRCAKTQNWLSAVHHYSRIADMVESGSRFSTLGVPLRAARCDLGVALLNSGDVRSALAQLQLVVRDPSPCNPEAILRAHLTLCEGFRLVEDYQAAESAYDDASAFAKSRAMTSGAIWPGFVWSPEIYLARLRYFQGELQAAIEICSDVLDGTAGGRLRDSESMAMASQIRGMSARDMGRLEEADSHLSAATAIRDGSRSRSLSHYEGLIEIGRLRLDQKRFAEAEPYFEKVRSELVGKVSSKHHLTARANGYLGLVRLSQNRLDEGKSFMRAAAVSQAVGIASSEMSAFTRAEQAMNEATVRCEQTCRD